MDHHTIATLSLAGVCLDLLGGLYLAYDLLGGQHGPLRLVTKMVTYSIVFGAGFGLGLGIAFGVLSGIASGVTVAIELQRTARDGGHYSLWWEAFFSVLRGLAFGAGLSLLAGVRVGALFGVLMAVGQTMAYMRGMRPGVDYEAARRTRITPRQAWGTAIRVVATTAAAFLCCAWAHIEHPWALAIRVGLVTGLVTAAGTAVNPLIEYYADNLPERRMGVFGVWLVLIGFVMQSFQYWVTLLDVKVT